MSYEYPISPDRVASDAPTCLYCGMPLPGGENEDGPDEDVAEFCSTACEDAHDTTGEALPEYESETLIRSGVNAIDLSMPQGMPRNSLNVISGEAGTRQKAVLAELAWRTLERGESVILVCFSDPPLAALQQFFSLKWNVIPHLEAGTLQLLDCYSHREHDRESTSVSGQWASHVARVAADAGAIRRVHDPGQPEQLERHLRTASNEMGLDCQGAIVIDSLTELGTMMREIQGYELIKDLRADFAKARNVTIYCGTHYAGYKDEYPHELEYLFDGMFDLSLNPKVVPGMLIKELTVRKMDGVMSLRERQPFEMMEHIGLMVIDIGDEVTSEEEATPEQAVTPETNPPHDRSESDRPRRKEEPNEGDQSPLDDPADAPLGDD
jgi:KaiC/GvpD/RAD55 family RecA-like ATPase